ncbi:MAG UNVERIFIED_CONTAM: GntR family transcriptional regulator, partial [Thermobifida fusca]
MSSSYPGRGVHGRVVELLGERVASGMIREGDTLDLRSLSAELGVSMSVVRESVRVLAAKGLVDSRQKRGTFVRPRTEWNLLDADVVRWRARGGDTARLMADLAELRALIEPAAARFAAQRRTENQLADLDQALD